MDSLNSKRACVPQSCSYCSPDVLHFFVAIEISHLIYDSTVLICQRQSTPKVPGFLCELLEDNHLSVNGSSRWTLSNLCQLSSKLLKQTRPRCRSTPAHWLLCSQNNQSIAAINPQIWVPRIHVQMTTENPFLAVREKTP